MKKLFLLMLLAQATSAANVQVNTIALTSSSRTNIPVRLVWNSPNPATSGTSLVSSSPVTQKTDASGNTIFTNVISAYYKLEVIDNTTTTFLLFVPTNQTTYAASALVTNAPPRPGTNVYLTTVTGDARYYPRLSNPSNYISSLNFPATTDSAGVVTTNGIGTNLTAYMGKGLGGQVVSNGWTVETPDGFTGLYLGGDIRQATLFSTNVSLVNDLNGQVPFGVSNGIPYGTAIPLLFTNSTDSAGKINGRGIGTNLTAYATTANLTTTSNGMLSNIAASNSVIRTEQIFNVMNFGAVGDGVTDDTAAIQSAIYAAGTNKGGVVFLPRTRRSYLLNASFTDQPGAGALTNYGKALLHLPAHNVDNGVYQITIRGEYAAPLGEQFPVGDTYHPDTNFTLITVTNTADSGNGAIIGGYYPSGVNWGQNGIVLKVENICFKTPPNPGYDCIRGQFQAGCIVDNVRIRALPDGAGVIQPSRTFYGIKLPGNNNWCTARLKQVGIYGYYGGVIAGENTSVDDLKILRAIQGINLGYDCFHRADFDHVIIGDTQYPIVGSTAGARSGTTPIGTPINFAKLTIEHGAWTGSNTWANTIADVYDPSNTLSGFISYTTIKSGVGTTNQFSMIGGTNLTTFGLFNQQFNRLTLNGEERTNWWNYASFLTNDYSVTSTLAFSNTAMIVSVPPGIYRVEAHAHFRNTGGSTQGFALKVNFPTGIFKSGTHWRGISGVTPTTFYMSDVDSGYSTIASSGGAADAGYCCQDFTLQATNTANTAITVQISQEVSNAAPTVIKAGSFLNVTRLK